MSTGIKNFTNTYLYSKSDRYEESIINNIMKAERIDKDDIGFKDILTQFKRRQVTTVLYKVLKSDNIILTHSEKPLPKALKVICVKDLKVDNELRVFIDCSAIMKKKDGEWQTRDIDILISYVMNAMVNYIYYKDNKRLTVSSKLHSEGTSAFSKLVTNIINYLFKINLLQSKRDKCIYLSSLYYSVNILGRDKDSSSVKNLCKNIADISEREAEMIIMELEEDDFNNIRTFMECLSRILKLDKLSVDVFIERWIFTYGTGTHFGLEYFPAFSAMLSDAYVGAYINNQKTIEKITGREMVDFTKGLFTIGESVVR